MTHENMLMLNAGLVFHAQENCMSEKRHNDLGEFEKKIETLIYRDIPEKTRIEYKNEENCSYQQYYCGQCDGYVGYKDKFCRHCGQVILWEAWE